MPAVLQCSTGSQNRPFDGFRGRRMPKAIIAAIAAKAMFK
jgi:hypothetical protein